MENLKERKAFKFYHSYYDVAMELSDNDFVIFMKALLEKQFKNVEPENLTGIPKLVYKSQKFLIDQQVDGFISKTNNPTKGGKQGGKQGPSVQEKEKEEVKKEKNLVEDIIENIEEDIIENVEDDLTDHETISIFLTGLDRIKETNIKSYYFLLDSDYKSLTSIEERKEYIQNCLQSELEKIDNPVEEKETVQL